MYCNNRYGTEWFIYLGSATCGLSAGLFWAAEGAIMLGCKCYLKPGKKRWRLTSDTDPEPHKRGRYLAYWLTYRNVRNLPHIKLLAANLTFCKEWLNSWRNHQPGSE